jgi:hypothetical protein
MARQLVKVIFELDPADWHGCGGEKLWAAPVAGNPMTFRLEDSPFFTRGISHKDVVRGRPAEDKTIFDSDQVIERAGHSTYMILVKDDEPRFHAYWTMLEEKGCTYESGHINLSIGRRLLLSVDVPPSSNLLEVRDILDRGERDHVWEFQEGYVHRPELRRY